MFCVRCGREMEETAAFCPACGTPARQPTQQPLMPAGGRLEGHIRLLGILWLAISAFRLVPGLVMAAIFDGPFPFPPDVPPFVPDLLRLIAMVFLCAGFVGLVTGIGLLMRKSWARMLAIIAGCVGLLDIPFGTALGIYTLWVLLPANSEREYQEIARAAERQTVT